MKIRELKKPVDDSTVTILREWLQQAEEGTLISVCIAGKRVGGEWQSGTSASQNGLEDAAMMMELAMRRLGFKQ
ncbi:hypothetical protein UFOVP274_50 [uncultured Caudovirales phage]|uniref:Uncharacterized protein n=1 Tax=uncultured Caudovirales phage TaxID=2100421 RepID=A0A6J5LP66_9CAUD|nr:hypothetical protein UFOVP274_50 [uncultured Caudovirales phage]